MNSVEAASKRDFLSCFDDETVTGKEKDNIG